MFLKIANAAAPGTFKELIEFTVFDLINPLIVLAGSLAVLAFFWGIARYIASAGDEKSKENGKNIMLYGIIALFVMFSVWGLIEILQNTFFEGSANPVAAPAPSPSPTPSPAAPGI